ncbi:unnamed protein product [Cuscuta epithymum]|uniref:glutathione transferase n=1 Tax=Cuscuta epithymum TaxID=186058 RepID=A0AAV0FYC4_9ASTE|nr:unnamed protein product [Cuscuta epithymum]
MVPKVYGSLMSPATLRVIACLKEKELKYELVPVNLQAGEHKKKPFLLLNPFGQVPAFEDGDVKLYESRAITRYIERTYADRGSQLVPKDFDNKELAIMRVWMEVEAQHFDKVASKLVFELIIKPMTGRVSDDADVARHENALTKVLDVYEKRLKVSKYLGGEYFTLVDLHHTPIISQLMGTKVKDSFQERPHVAAWVSKLLARPAWASSSNSSSFLLCFECSIYVIIFCVMLYVLCIYLSTFKFLLCEFVQWHFTI